MSALWRYSLRFEVIELCGFEDGIDGGGAIEVVPAIRTGW